MRLLSSFSPYMVTTIRLHLFPIRTRSQGRDHRPGDKSHLARPDSGQEFRWRAYDLLFRRSAGGVEKDARRFLQCAAVGTAPTIVKARDLSHPRRPACGCRCHFPTLGERSMTISRTIIIALLFTAMASATHESDRIWAPEPGANRKTRTRLRSRSSSIRNCITNSRRRRSPAHFDCSRR